MNRGRIQAQGDNTEKSAPWAVMDDHYKHMGIYSVSDLEGQLTRSELRLRVKALRKCRQRILTTPHCGVTALMKKSYYDDVRNREIRIDIEVSAGIAFKDNPPSNSEL